MSSAGQHRLFHRLQTAAHLLRTQADRRLVAAAGVTTAQCALLAVLAADGPSPQRAAAGRLGLNESAMTPMVRRLVEAGLVERRADPEDRRVRALALTEAGQAALATARAPFAEINAILDDALGPAGAQALARALEAVSKGARGER